VGQDEARWDAADLRSRFKQLGPRSSPGIGLCWPRCVFRWLAWPVGAGLGACVLPGVTTTQRSASASFSSCGRDPRDRSLCIRLPLAVRRAWFVCHNVIGGDFDATTPILAITHTSKVQSNL
jgi:hypothetical protein